MNVRVAITQSHQRGVAKELLLLIGKATGVWNTCEAARLPMRK